MLPSSLSFSTTTTTPMPLSRTTSAGRRHTTTTFTACGGSSSSSPPCKHSPADTLDLLILIVVLCSCAFLLASSLSYIFTSLSLLLPPSAIALFLFTVAFIAGSRVCCLLNFNWFPWSRKCGNPKCRGLKKAMEFDVQLQSEDSVRSGGGVGGFVSGMHCSGAGVITWNEIDALPWKGGQGGNNPDYECLRQELRRMAPPNGRAVLLFRARCGCPLAKLEGWAPKPKPSRKEGFC